MNTSGISYKSLREPILSALTENSPLSYNLLYKIVKYKAICSERDISCEYCATNGRCSKIEDVCNHYTIGGGCSKKGKPCKYCSKTGNCLQKIKFCKNYEVDGSCSKKGKSCSLYDKTKGCIGDKQFCKYYKIEGIYSKQTYSKCIKYLIYIGEIERKEIKRPRKPKVVNLFIKGEEYFPASYELNDVRYGSYEVIKLNDPMRQKTAIRHNRGTSYSHKFNGMINGTSKKNPIVKEYTSPFGFKTTNFKEITIFHKKGTPYFNKYIEKIKARREILQRYSLVENESSPTFAARHSVAIVHTITDLLKNLINYLYECSEETDDKTASDLFKAKIETHLDTGFWALRLLVKSPLKMNSRIYEIIGRSFDYAVSTTVSQGNHIFNMSPEEKGRVLKLLREIEGSNTDMPKYVVFGSKMTYMERIKPIMHILDRSTDPIQRNELHTRVTEEIGVNISHQTLGKCLDYLVFIGLIEVEKIGGMRGKRILISKKKDLSYSSFYYNIQVSWQMEKLLKCIQCESPSVIESAHYIIIWAYINYILRILVQELTEYSNAADGIIADKNYSLFLTTQLLPSLANLCKLVRPPLKMSMETKELLNDELLDYACSAVNNELNQFLGSVTQEEYRVVTNILMNVNTSHPRRRDFTHFDSECLAEEIENDRLTSIILNAVRRKNSDLNQSSTVKLGTEGIKCIVTLKEKGVKSSTIAETLGISVRRMQQIYQEYCNTGSEPHVGKNRGRPPKSLSDEEKKIIEHVYSDHKVGACSLEKIIGIEYNQKISHNKIHKYLLSIREFDQGREGETQGKIV